MTNHMLVQTSPLQRLLEWVNHLREMISQGLTSDRSSIDAVYQWLTNPSPPPSDLSDPSLWFHGLLYEPVAIGLAVIGVTAAIGTTLSTCQELRAAEEKGFLDDVEGVEWVRVAATVMGDTDIQLQSGQRLFQAVIVIGALSVVGGLFHYYFIVIAPGLQLAIRALLVDLFAGLFVVFLVGLLSLPFVGGPTAYLYTLYQAAKALG